MPDPAPPFSPSVPPVDLPVPATGSALPQRVLPSASAEISPMKVHEVALLRFCFLHFPVVDGYPTPAVFAGPSDAMAVAQDTWRSAANPWAYLTGLSDVNGQPAYRVDQPFHYPLISIKRAGWALRVNQSYGLRRYRRLGYPTQSRNPEDIRHDDLAHVVQARMPTAWDFRFQLDHYALYPDTQALFVQSLMSAFSVTGGSAQTWMPVAYPGWFGVGQKYCRVYLSGDIEDVSPEEPGDARQEYRTSVSLTVEGYAPDPGVTIVPTLWKAVARVRAPGPAQVAEIYATAERDLRVKPLENLAFATQPHLPPPSDGPVPRST